MAKQLSAIAKEMAKMVLIKENASPEAVATALKIVHLAWNLAGEEYYDDPAYLYGIKEIDELLSSVKKQFISSSTKEMVDKLMSYKLKNYPKDKRTIFFCELQNGNVKVRWT